MDRMIKIVEKRHFTSASLMNKSTTAKTTKFNLQTIIQKPRNFNPSKFSTLTVSNLPFISNLVSDITISLEEVRQALITLQPRKASGPDNIGPRVLKSCADSLALPLHHLFWLSLNDNSIPAEWKKHTIIIIITVYNSSDKTDLKNYRPISLRCSISTKVFERLVYNKVIGHISKFVSSYQFGFQNKIVLASERKALEQFYYTRRAA